MAETNKQKPGVRTKLNSGENKVKLREEKNGKASAQPNPTAASASKKLPSMKLTNDTNWAEETSNFVLNAAAPVSSERSLGDNKVVPVKETTKLIPAEPPKQEDIQVKKEPKNKYKEKVKTKNILDDIKTSITQSIDNVKVDYEQLAKIQESLKTSADDVKTTMGDRVNRIKDYANSAMASMPNSEAPKKKKKKKIDYDIPKEPIPETPKEEPKQKKIKQESSVTTEELQEAAKVAAESSAQKDNKDLSQKLNQAIQRRDGAKRAVSALNAQLKYASGEQKQALEERVALKAKQLEDAEKLVEQLQAEYQANQDKE